MSKVVGDLVPPVTVTASLETSVRYAGASGDHNPLHYDPAFAAVVSPTKTIIAHGMFSMGLVSRAVTAFAGGPDRVEDLQVRFTRPWPLGETATFDGTVTAVNEDTARVELRGSLADGERIMRGTATIRL
jgi:acyl dehydratase